MHTLPEELSAKFDPSEVKVLFKSGKEMPYVSIDATIRRLNSVLGSDWSTRLEKSELTPIYGPEGEPNGYLAHVAIEMSVLLPLVEDEKYQETKTAVGVGADVSKDADKAVKTALAEAIKKAGHQLGIGLYLWVEEERDKLEELRKMPLSELQKMMVAVYQQDKKTDKYPTALQLKDHFDIGNLNKETCAEIVYWRT